ncbi:transposase [Thalassobacillus sp. B23F22_16]|uniref:transposase n=1 Tax=Thalassobacillus sp. B23F22_16 TaxID=3459513 RepID=UPI00373E7530
MSRKPRQWYPGARYHITARGNRGAAVFFNDDDYDMYLQLILRCQKEIPFTVHAFCLMTNHIHLLLEVYNHPPGEIMQFIQFRYAKYFNKQHKFNGHLFQGRYYSKLIETTSYFLAASKYIHLNPVNAGMVAVPEAYRWSSYPAYLGKEQHSFLTRKPLLDCFVDPKIQRYKNYIEEKGGKAYGDYCEEYRPEGA